MITRNEKAKGLWWRLLAMLPVLAILLIANTKVVAQEKKADQLPVNTDSYQIVMYEYDWDEKLPLNDTVIYNEDGSYSEVRREQEIDPVTNKPRTKISISAYDKDGKPASGFHIHETSNAEEGDTRSFRITPKEGFVFPATINMTTEKEEPKNDSIYQIVEEMPQYPGGEKAMMEFVAKNITYPQEARDHDIQGRVFIGFVVEKDGSIGEVKVLRSIGGGCDEEAVRVVKAMPKWKPGIQKGEPVRVSYMMPVNFKLKEDKSSKTANKVDANEPDMKPDKNGVYQIVEEMPRFPGDDKALMEYLQNNLEVPEKYKHDDGEFRLTEYRTFVRFIVTEDGSVSDVKIIKKTEGFKDLDEEALRVVKAMPKWNPGKMDGKPVKVYFHLPVIFKFKK